MDQFRKLFANISLAQRVTIVAVALAVGAGLFAFARWRRESDFRPLYTTLAPEDAGAVVQKLKEGGVEYRLSENGSTVLVPSAKLAEMRLELAAAGLPKSGRIGFELFDKTNFGATEFVEHINYRRALEGELERTVMSLAEVEQARVHLTFPKESVYLDSRQPAKASVVVKVRPGAQLLPQNVIAIEHLLASAVEGLAPEAVSVLDMRGNLLSRTRAAAASDGGASSDRLLEARQSIEHDLVAKINSTLEPLLGADKYRAGASVECDFSSADQSEEIFDPARSVMVSSQKSEDTSNNGGGAAGVPGTAANLPRPPQRPATAMAGTSRRSESIAYQSSRVVRHVKTPEGSLKRMSLVVLVDHAVRWEGQGNKMRRVLDPPTPEKLKSIRDLVAAATGFSADRGDQLIVESLPFESTLNFEPPAPNASPQSRTNVMNLPPWLARALENRMIVGGAVLAGVFLLIVIKNLSKKLFKRKKPETASAPVELPPAPVEKVAQIDYQKQDHLEEEALQAQLQAAAAKSGAKKSAVLVKHVRDTIAKDAMASSQVVRGWLNDGT